MRPTCDTAMTRSYWPMSCRNWPTLELLSLPPCLWRSALMMAAVETRRRTESVFHGNQVMAPRRNLLDID